MCYTRLDACCPAFFYRILLIFVASGVGCGRSTSQDHRREETTAATHQQIRVMTYNVEDIRTAELGDRSTARLKTAAATIQQLRPDILLINEIAVISGEEALGQPGKANNNAQRFADYFLAVSQGEDLAPLHYRTFMGDTNTGVASGFDLDNNGEIITQSPPLNPSREQSKADIAYGGDCWGFGAFPGQYGMALFVRADLAIDIPNIRTFQMFQWNSMPQALRPVDPRTGQPWYDDEEWSALRLSSKSHWDIPVQLGNGQIVHALCSHPTPPVFDGPEDRNGRRNHDEIRFWADYLNNANYIVDDDGHRGGLSEDAYFAILGDLNADPDRPAESLLPTRQHLLTHPRINGEFIPLAVEQVDSVNAEDEADNTSTWGMRVDYVLPSANCEIVAGQVARLRNDPVLYVSDHFPVWVDLKVESAGPSIAP